MIKRHFKDLLLIILVVGVSFFAIKPLFSSYLFVVHDNAAAERIFEMVKGLKDGQFPVRWVSDLGYGYGYPLFNFYAPLPYYIGAFFNIIGVPLVLSTKLVLGIGVLFSAVSMYLLAREFWGRVGAIVCAIFYMYAPYHAVQIYVRGSVGEYYGYALLPFIIWALFRLIKNGRKRYFALFVLSFTAILLSHNILAFLVTPMLGAFTILVLFRNKWRNAGITILSFIIALLLASFFLIPAISEKQYTNVDSVITNDGDFHNHFVCINQLWDSPWGFGGSAKGCVDGLSFRIGKLHILALISTLFAIFVFWRRREKTKIIAILLALLLFIFSVFLMLPASAILWEKLPLFPFIQFPWRFLTFVVFSASFVSGAVILIVYKINRYLGILLSLVVTFILIFSLQPKLFDSILFRPQSYMQNSEEFYSEEKHLVWNTSRVSDEYLPKDFLIPKDSKDTVTDKLVILDGKATTYDEKASSNKVSFGIDVSAPTLLLIKTAVFPGWKTYVNGSEQTFLTLNKQMALPFNPGNYNVNVILTNTAVRIFSNILSILGVLLFSFMITKRSFPK